MTALIVTFGNGTTVSPPRRVAYTHAWIRAGKLASGRPFELHGFSISGEANARKQMCSQTGYLRKANATFEFEEIVPVECGVPA